jgi:ankyrin repeat protein
MNKHPEIALYLIEQGAAVDPLKKNAGGPLHAVAMVGPAEVARALLGKKADVNARDGDHGATPAMWAANRGQLEVLKLLIEHKADLNLGDENRITRDAGGRTALMYANPERLDIVGLLLDHGADPNVRNLQGKNYLEAVEEQLELDKRPERQQAWQAVRDFLKARLAK